MSLEPLMRQLSLEGCRAVGRNLATRLQDLRANGISLPLVVEAEANQVIQRADDLSDFVEDDLSMNQVDQGADRMIAGFHGLFVARELCYGAEQIVELLPEEQAQFSLSQETRKIIFPQGTAFTQGSHEDQWAGLLDVRKRLSFPQVQERLAALGLGIEAGRLLRWIDRYGQRLGVLPDSPTGRGLDAILAMDRFHAAWQSFTLELRHAFKDGTPASVRVKSLLLAPYENQVLAEEKASKAVRRS